VQKVFVPYEEKIDNVFRCPIFSIAYGSLSPRRCIQASVSRIRLHVADLSFPKLGAERPYDFIQSFFKSALKLSFFKK
jgi:hypothetical protein